MVDSEAWRLAQNATFKTLNEFGVGLTNSQVEQLTAAALREAAPYWIAAAADDVREVLLHEGLKTPSTVGHPADRGRLRDLNSAVKL